MNDSETEDVLHAINPNDVFPSGTPGEALSESDSGISEDPCSKTPPGPSEPLSGRPTVYQVVYDISSLSSIKTEPEQHSVDVISIELGELCGCMTGLHCSWCMRELTGDAFAKSNQFPCE